MCNELIDAINIYPIENEVIVIWNTWCCSVIEQLFIFLIKNNEILIWQDVFEFIIQMP